MATSDQHLIRELSTEKGLLSFDRDLREFLGESGPLKYVVEPEISGLEVIMVYEKGAFRSASFQERPVASSIKTILTVPLTFTPLTKQRIVPDYLEVRAVVYMETELFIRLNQQRQKENLPTFPHVRAGVKDSLAQADLRISTKRSLNYFCSGARKAHGLHAETHYELMIGLQELGLRVNRPHMKVVEGIHGVIDSCRDLKANREGFAYPVEGALIRIDSLGFQARLSRDSAYARGEAAFKF